MLSRSKLFLAFLLMLGSAWGQRQGRPPNFVTLVYDAPAREFTCWFESNQANPIPTATFPADPCHNNPDARQVRDGVYFFRGQTVRVLLKGAVIADLFSLDLQVNDIQEPTTPVFGAAATLPTLTGLVPAPSIFAGPSSTLAGGAAVSLDLYPILDKVESKDLAAYLNYRLMVPTSLPALQPLVTPDFNLHIQELRIRVPGLFSQARAIQADLSAIPDPGDFAGLLDGMRRFNGVLDRERALREEVTGSAIAPHAQLVSAAYQTAADPQLEFFRDLVLTAPPSTPGDTAEQGRIKSMPYFNTFIGNFQAAFPPPQRRYWIDQLDVSPSAKVSVVSGGLTSNEVTYTSAVAGPSIQTLAPAAASAGAGPLTLTVSGSGFSSAATVQWSGAPLPTSFVSSSQLNASVPASLLASAGLASVTVVLGSRSSDPANFLVWAGPAIASVTPVMVSAGGPAFTLTIRGSGFATGAKVLWNGVKLADPTATGTTMLVVSVPAANIASAGQATVTVSADDKGTSNSVLIPIGPTISDLNPPAAPSGPGNLTLTVNGQGFGAGALVRWNDITLTPTTVTPTRLTVTVPNAELAKFGRYVMKVLSPQANLFLASINLSLTSLGPDQIATQGSLQRLKANLNMLADRWDDILLAKERVETFQHVWAPLKAERASPDAVNSFQDYLNSLTANSVNKAMRMDTFARLTPLPDSLRLQVVGVWYGSEEIVLTVNQGGRLTLYDLGGVSSSTPSNLITVGSSAGAGAPPFALAPLAPPAGGPSPPTPPATASTKTETASDKSGKTTTTTTSTASVPAPAASPAPTPSAAPTGTPPATPPAPAPAAAPTSPQVAPNALTAARSLTFRIHNLYHFQLAAGFVYSTARDDQFQVYSVQPTGAGGATGGSASGSGLPPQQLITQTRSRSYNLLPTAELLIYPFAQDFFPFKPRFPGERGPSFLRTDLAALIGISMTSPSRDFLFGGAWFPRQKAVGIQFGLHLALRDYPPDNAALDTPLTQAVIVMKQKVKPGAFVGVSLSSQLFKDIFGYIFKQ